ncbi:hypothetical protein D3C77_683090 [compost metagenome]
MIGNHVAEAQLPAAAEHELEPLSNKLLRHEETSRKAIRLPLCGWTRYLQRTPIKGTITMHDGILVKHEMADLMGSSEELDFFSELCGNCNLDRLTINQACNTSTGVVPIELRVP